MIKNIQDQDEIVISVKLKNGDHFINRDIPVDPFGLEGWISFWTEEGTVRSYPLESVEYYEFVPEGGPDDDSGGDLHDDPDDLLTEGEKGKVPEKKNLVYFGTL